ncbi:hypothetical protein BCR39DRAFT_536933 [Naematelia encephala]|uniref:Protein CPL1-like domain-containing protein n=1 Tax=Naematelia encephala TaxID=71784 RepID=A0A1Y2AZT4_9TREE|nr:hypothetical protein BCR39DRAFT_536933 [Naematelia encephala]
MSGKMFVLALTLASLSGQAVASALLGCAETSRLPETSRSVEMDASSGIVDCVVSIYLHREQPKRRDEDSLFQVACSGSRYSFWQQDEALCQCSNELGDNDIFIPSLSPIASCPTDSSAVTQLRTPFRLDKCYSTISPTRHAISPAVSSASECLSHCSTHAHASFVREGSDVACTCFDAATFGEPEVCGSEPSTVAVYRRGVSTHGRKKKAARPKTKNVKQAPMSVCEQGKNQCPGVAGGLQCLDWQNDVESCGGCTELTQATVSLYPAGVNCSLLPGVESGKVSCRSSKCFIEECRVGWTLIRGTCVKTLRRR